MANIVTLPQAPNNSLGLLGQVLLGSATDYANNRHSDEREARLREQRLADIQGERAYEQQTHARGRTERLADVADERAYSKETSEREARMAFAREMVRTGYLAPDKLNDEAAVNEAATRFGRDGLATRYTEAIKSGDLAYADLGDAARVAAGLAKFSDRLAKHTQFQDALPQQAGVRANQLATERDQLLRTSSELERRLAEPEPVPSSQQVAQVALRLAQSAKKPGEMPSAIEISQMTEQAQGEIQNQLAMKWNQQRQDALVQRQLLNDRLRDVSTEINTLTNRFGVVGSASSSPSSLSPPQVSSPSGDINSARTAFASRVSSPAPSAAVTARAPTVAPVDPFATLSDLSLYDRPMMQQGRNRTFAPESPELFDDAAGVAQREIERLATVPQNRATAQRLSVLRNTLTDIQRRRDQTITNAAKNRLSEPASTATDTFPAQVRRSGLQWWELAPTN